MTTGKKRPDAYQKKAKAANKSPRLISAKYSKSATEVWNKMSDAEKAPFVDMAKERKARINKHIPKEKKKNASPVFRSRCSPLKLVKVNEALTKEQKDVVERVGFSSMLKLKCRMLNREFISRSVNHFNPVTKSLEFGRVRVYTITPDDVRRALRLSCGTIAVPTDCEDHHFEHIRKMFGKRKKSLKRRVTFAMMQQEIAKYNKICAKVVGGKNKKDSIGVAGCVLLLMLIYFGKQPMGMKVGSEGEPMIQSWTTKLIKERIAKEVTLELYTIAAFHDLKKYFLNQMQHLFVLDGALMGDVPETCTQNLSKRKASIKRKNRNEDDVEMGDVHMDSDNIPSTSTFNPKEG
ncbi:hypothetical protein RHGRI_001799 [Rhododendron griersonianum]|uniref:HMG box domain-containing protein n=1 Tax=Rhododendron griersonianum TaxID=479676 RepID=A0AAV6LPR1_9ERIC|nr:hypothetical protein RHGRI_001799 [Rhododendron griersonianum]